MMLEVLDRFIEDSERKRLSLKIPRETGLMQKNKGTHFHYKPEFFFQLAGETHFSFPKEAIDLLEGEFCIIPAGLPHGEQVKAGKEPFRNLVIGLYSHTLSFHFAKEVQEGKPDIDVMEFFDAPDLETYVTLSQSLIRSFHAPSPARDQIMSGLIQALFGMFKNLLLTGSGDLNADLGKVFEAKWLVREQFADPELNVSRIAGKLGCSPDYLSHLFHKETKEKLVHYIQRIRIDGAAMALENSALYVSEIAYASGFSDPAYFARVFKNRKGESPQEFRARLEARRRGAEDDPKTTYFDREDFSHGSPSEESKPTKKGKRRKASAKAK